MGSPAAEAGRREVRQAMAALLVAVLTWGLAPVATRFLIGRVDALPLLAIRFAVAGVVLVPFARSAGMTRWPRQDIVALVVCSLLGVTGYYLPATVGQRWTSAGMTGLVLATEPLLILFAWSVRDRRWPSPVAAAGTVVALIGVALLLGGRGGDSGRASGPAHGLLGPALVFAAAVSWSIYCVAVVDLARRRGALATTVGTTLVGALPLLVLGLPAAGPAARALGVLGWCVLVALALGSTVAGTVLWNYGLAVVRGPRPGAFLYLVPLISVVGGRVLLGETVSSDMVLGGVLVVGGVALAQVTMRGAGVAVSAAAE